VSSANTKPLERRKLREDKKVCSVFEVFCFEEFNFIVMEKIKVEFEHEKYMLPLPQEEEQKELTDYVNKALEDIKEAVIKYNCYVKIVITNNGNYRFEPVCDHEDLRNEMGDLLPDIMPPKSKFIAPLINRFLQMLAINLSLLTRKNIRLL
jgi:hypothetical protein